jgi:hypothetical protein
MASAMSFLGAWYLALRPRESFSSDFEEITLAAFLASSISRRVDGSRG